MKNLLSFLTQLQRNNSKEWFTQHRQDYDDARAEFTQLYEQITLHLEELDTIDRKQSKIFRIYRDVRFSKDKSPYKQAMSSHWVRQGASRRGGFYLQIQPGASFLAGGFFAPSKEDLALIRGHLHQDPTPLHTIISQPNIKDTFGQLEGDKVKTAPKGFSQDDPAIDLIRYKQFFLRLSLSDEVLITPNFQSAKLISEHFSQMLPFLDYMTELLTTDLNGQSLLEPNAPH